MTGGLARGGREEGGSGHGTPRGGRGRARHGGATETRPRKARVSVVIPALNEADNLRFVLPHLPPEVDEVVIVDGRSTDDTVKTARRLRPGAVIVEQEGCGKGDALAAGFRAATGEVVIMLDADGSTDPAEIPRFLEALDGGADVAKGSRFAPGGGSRDITRFRSLGNRALTRLVNARFGTRYSDLCYGYNAFRAECLPDLHVDCAGFEVETLIHIRVAKAGLRVVEVPSVEHSRVFGVSNLNAVRDGWRVLKIILREAKGGPRHSVRASRTLTS